MSVIHQGDGHAAALEKLMIESEDWLVSFGTSELSACPACQALCMEHQQLALKLGALGQDEASNVEAALAGPAPGAGGAEAVVRAQVLGRKPARRGRLLLMMVALAAAVLFMLWKPVSAPGPEFDPGIFLGDGGAGLQPGGEVADFARFAWTGDLPVGGWYLVNVYRLEAQRTLRLLHRTPRLRENHWQPAIELQQAWPNQIIWKLETHRGTSDSDRADVAWQRAERSSAP